MRRRATQLSHPRGSPWGLARSRRHRPARRERHLGIPGSVLPARAPGRWRDGMLRPVALTTIHRFSYLFLCSLLRGYVLFIILLILLSKK